MTRPLALLLVPVLALALAACGSAGDTASSAVDKASSAASEAGVAGAYQAVDAAAGTFDDKARTYSANLQGCLDQASGDQAKEACGSDAITQVRQGWAPVQSALDGLTGVADGDCKAGLQAVSDQATVWTKDAAPGSAQEAEALPTRLSDGMDGVVQALGDLKTACT